METKYVKDSYLNVTLYDVKGPLFKVSFDLSNIDFIKILNDLKVRGDVSRYLVFKKILKGELIEELTSIILNESKNKILEIINTYTGLGGILEKPAKDIKIVRYGSEGGEIYFIIAPQV